MNPVIIIPTFISAGRRRSEVKGIISNYDHTTNIHAPGELERCLASLQKVEDLGAIMVLVAADRSVEDQAAAKIRALLDKYPDLQTILIGAPELAIIRRRLDALNLGSLTQEISLRGYGAVRNLGLLVADILGFDAVVFLDDDETIDDPEFLHKAMYGLGKLTRKGVPILAKTGYYLNNKGSYLSKQEDKWYNRFWQQGAAFNKWISSAMHGPRLSRGNHICGGCLAIHKEVFSRLAFDPWIPRGEDLDYMIDLRIYGSDIWFDNQWYLNHLPPATKSEGNRFRQDIFRWIYEHAKLEYSHSLIDLHKVTAQSLEPYPGPFLEPSLMRRIRITAFLRSLVRPDKKAYRRAALEAAGEATRYAEDNCTKYFEFQRVWSQITQALDSDRALSEEIVRSSFEGEMPQTDGIDPGVTTEIQINVNE